MKYWEGVIYRAIESLGGEADLQEIYRKLPDLIDLTEEHLRTTKWGEDLPMNILLGVISQICVRVSCSAGYPEDAIEL